MPESGQLYVEVEEGRTAQAAPPKSVTSSSSGRMEFSIELPSPVNVLSARPRLAEEPQAK